MSANKVDDPCDYVYAMGGKPVFALAILGMPLGKIAPEQVREIREGGREVCSAAGIPVAGGHSIDAPEPAPSELRRNCDAKPGDILILTKNLLALGFTPRRLKRMPFPPAITAT
jgi:selenophosphate synthase